MKRAILPARRLRLRFGYQLKIWLGALACLGGAVGLALGASWFVSSAITNVRDHDVWDHGVVASDGSISGKRSSKLGLDWLIASYDAKVRYTDDRGDQYEGSLYFMTMFGGPDTDAAAEVRYAAGDHGRFAVSWGIEASGARWRAAIFFTLLLALLTLTFGYATLVIVRGLRDEARVAATGDEVELRVVSCQQIIKDGKTTGKWQYQLELDDGSDQPRRISKQLPWLLSCGTDNTRTLALWRPGDRERVILIEADLAPLAVSEAERAEAVKRAEAS